MFCKRAHCQVGFPTYRFISCKFTHTLSRLKTLIGNTKLKNEKFEELEKHVMFFGEKELELEVYMDDDELEKIRTELVSAQGQEKSRVVLREEMQEQTEERVRNVMLGRPLSDMFMAIIKKTFICILASSNQQKLNDFAENVYIPRSSLEENQTNGILFYDTKAHLNVSLTEMVNGNFKFTEAKSSSTEEMGSLYTRVESVLRSRIKYILRLMLEFLTAHLPCKSKEEPVDLFELEKYVTEDLDDITALWMIRYEVLGWIRCTKIDIGVQMPEAPKLPEKLQRELLRLKGVEGCGTILGRLTLMVTADKVQDIEMLVPDILRKHKHNYQHRVLVFLKTEMHAGSIDAGSKLNLKSPDLGDINGTLGCLVTGKQKSASPDFNTSSTDIYAITCEHVVSGCSGDINIGFIKISSIDETISKRERDAVDIAAMKISKSIQKYCKLELSIESTQDVNVADVCKHWGLYDGEAGDSDLHNHPVFKKGSVSNFTHGTVICNDYRTKDMERVVQEGSYKFEDLYHILIAPIYGSDKGTEFSKPGDSGAAVCRELVNDNKLEVISLLQGSFSCQIKDNVVNDHETPNPCKDGAPKGNAKPKQGEMGKGAEGSENDKTPKEDAKQIFLFSFSSPMKKSLRHLGRGLIFDAPAFCTSTAMEGGQA